MNSVREGFRISDFGSSGYTLQAARCKLKPVACGMQLEPVPKPPVPCAGSSCKMRKARGAWRTRRRVRERRVPRLGFRPRSGRVLSAVEGRATQRSDADRPSLLPEYGLRRHAAIYSVSSPWRSASTTPSSSFLVSGGMASATQGTRGLGTGSSQACSLQPAACSMRHSAFRNPQSGIRSAFTLVELLVVIAILGILMSLVMAGAQAARRRGALTKAKTTIAALDTAIAMYSSDMGEYPMSGNKELVKALQEGSGDVDWQGPYMEFKQDELKENEAIDPWGHPYIYVSVNGASPKHRERSYDLYSFGPNGVDDQGTGDDVINW